MSSVTSSGPRQVSNNGAYFIPVGDARGKIYAITSAGAVTVAEWASTGYSVGIVSSLQATNASGPAVLRDMGKTVVSSNRTFRKVQYVMSTNSTFGVGGKAGTTPLVDYLTGYVELGFEGGGVPTPVAQFGR
uniref:Uncharacterized protein n=1 Tax=viral metagenome TaxID=1070528 RepID=A0A6C0DD04_9ZZZZ